jgi:SH3 domain protein
MRAAILLPGLVAAAMTVHAEDAFVGSGGFRAGLHQEQSSDSPIVKLVPAGAVLQVLKREQQATLVRDSDGVQGWIENSYLATEPPAASPQGEAQRKRIEDLERQLEQARAELAQMESRLTGAGKAGDDFRQLQQVKREKQGLEQQLQQEKLRSGEAHVELTELRKRIGMDGDTESLLKEIADLQAENRKLRIDSGAAAGPGGDGDAGVVVTDGRIDLGRLAASAIVILLLVGFVGGIYVMDYLNRRRHGGFRV